MLAMIAVLVTASILISLESVAVNLHNRCVKGNCKTKFNHNMYITNIVFLVVGLIMFIVPIAIMAAAPQTATGGTQGEMKQATSVMKRVSSTFQRSGLQGASPEAAKKKKYKGWITSGILVILVAIPVAVIGWLNNRVYVECEDHCKDDEVAKKEKDVFIGLGSIGVVMGVVGLGLAIGGGVKLNRKPKSARTQSSGESPPSLSQQNLVDNARQMASRFFGGARAQSGAGPEGYGPGYEGGYEQYGGYGGYDGYGGYGGYDAAYGDGR